MTTDEISCIHRRLTEAHETIVRAGREHGEEIRKLKRALDARDRTIERLRADLDAARAALAAKGAGA